MGMHQVVSFLVLYGAPLLFACVLAENLGAPIPSIPMLLAMGALIGAGDHSFMPMWALAVLAVVLADWIWYFVGQRKGHSVLRLLCRISLEPDSCVSSTRSWFQKLGAWALVITKFVPGLGIIAAPMAGLTHMRLWKFVIADGAGAMLWSGTYLGAGYLFRTQLEELAAKLAQTGVSLFVGVACLVIGWVAYKYWQRRRFLRNLRVARLTPEELKARLNDFVILDLRSATEVEWDGMKLPGAIRIELRKLAERHEEIPRDRDIVLYCT